VAERGRSCERGKPIIKKVTLAWREVGSNKERPASFAVFCRKRTCSDGSGVRPGSTCVVLVKGKKEASSSREEEIAFGMGKGLLGNRESIEGKSLNMGLAKTICWNLGGEKKFQSKRRP